MTNLQNIRSGLTAAGLDALLLMDDKNIFYAIGFRPTDSALLITGDDALFVTDSRYIEAATAQRDPDCRIEMATRERKLTQCMAGYLQAKGVKTLGFEEDLLPYAQYSRLSQLFALPMTPAQSILHELRARKNPGELESLIAAQRIAEGALDHVLGMIRPGISERAVAAELSYRMLLGGGEGNSFDPIVVCSAKGSMPHGVPGDELIADGDFVTMDFGTLKNGYCSDMTRTVAVGHVTEEMRRVYDTVYAAQAAGIAAARPGARGCDIHNAAAKVIEDAGYGEYFGHGFGHSLGLDIHESPSANTANDQPMPEGAVISAEPGIYLPGRFGVRIEDVLYLTGEGCINITKAPKQLIIL